MISDPRQILGSIDTLMLDMDGTLLDLAFDNYMWLDLIPAEYARRHGLQEATAREQLYAHYARLLGSLDWYCLDHWSVALGLDILGLHRKMRGRIGWLPGAREFLEAARTLDVRLLLVSNSHPDTLALKTEATGIAAFFDGVYLSHDLGHPKEQLPFWQALHGKEAFDPVRTAVVDDTGTVLKSAQQFGINNLFAITRPDSTGTLRTGDGFAGIESVAELLPGTRYGSRSLSADSAAAD